MPVCQLQPAVNFWYASSPSLEAVWWADHLTFPTLAFDRPFPPPIKLLPSLAISPLPPCLDPQYEALGSATVISGSATIKTHHEGSR